MSALNDQAVAWHRYRDACLRDGAEQTVNGPGSTLASTGAVRAWLPRVFAERNIFTMLDAPCGDGNWISEVDLAGIIYLGWDVVAANALDAKLRVSGKASAMGCATWRRNLLADDTQVTLVDLILCRDFLPHLTNRQIAVVLKKFVDSGSRWLITNNYRDAANDVSCPDEGHAGAVGSAEPWRGYYYRPVNLEAEPFRLAGRTDSIVEDAGAEQYAEITQELVLFDLAVVRRRRG